MTKILKYISFVLMLLYLNIAAQTKANLPLFKTDDVVCFIGNSITHGGTYHTFFESYYATRYPEQKIRYYNCGIAGDNIDGMLERLDEDVLSHKPTYAFIMTGMNDVQRLLYTKEKANDTILLKRQQALDNYYKKTEELAVLLIKNDVKPIFISPSIYDQTANLPRFNDYGTNDALALCADHMERMAEKYNAPFVDFFSIMDRLNKELQKSDPEFTIVGEDRVHPGEMGHFIMAYQMISAIAPEQYVTRFEYDARNIEIIEPYNCEVQIVDDQSLIFDIQAKALPYPNPESLSFALGLVPFNEQLNKEIFKVTHLESGQYEVYIDSLLIGSYSSKDLSKGINLAQNTLTPQYKQAEEVYKICFELQQIQGRLRNIPFTEYRMLKDFTGPDTVEAKRAYLDVLLEQQKGKSWYDWNVKTCNLYFETLPIEKQLLESEKTTLSTIYEVNKPRKHRYQLVKI